MYLVEAIGENFLSMRALTRSLFNGGLFIIGKE